MPTSIHCSACGYRATLPDKTAATTFWCPSCRQPLADEPEPSAPSPSEPVEDGPAEATPPQEPADAARVEARQRLQQLFSTHGYALFDDFTRCQSLIRHSCESSPDEAEMLATALEHLLAADFLVHKGTIPFRDIGEQVAARLVDDGLLDRAAARWAVSSWGIVLGEIAADMPDPEGSARPFVEPDGPEARMAALENTSPTLAAPPASKKYLIPAGLALTLFIAAGIAFVFQSRTRQDSGASGLVQDHRLIQGTWKVASFLEPSAPKGGAVADVEVDINSDQIVIHEAGFERRDFRYVINPAQTPRHIDIAFSRWRFSLTDRAETPPAPPKTLKGIYQLDGDDLQFCVPLDPEQQRPAAFTDGAAGKTALVVLKRDVSSESPADRALRRNLAVVRRHLADLRKKDANVQTSAAQAIVKLEPRENKSAVADILAVALTDPQPYARQLAVYVLENIKPEAEDVLPPLVKVLQDNDGAVRAAGVRALSQLGRTNPKATPAMTPALMALGSTHKNPEVRRSAVEVLQAISGSDVRQNSLASYESVLKAKDAAGMKIAWVGKMVTSESRVGKDGRKEDRTIYVVRDPSGRFVADFPFVVEHKSMARTDAAILADRNPKDPGIRLITGTVKSIDQLTVRANDKATTIRAPVIEEATVDLQP